MFNMFVENLYGGYDIRYGFMYDNQRTRKVLENNLSVGDIIIAEWGETPEIHVFVYLSDSTLLYISSSDGVCCYKTISDNELNNILVTLLAYDRYAVLRPTMK